ncbi:MAG: site-specific integrase [Ferruginibacter sp.]
MHHPISLTIKKNKIRKDGTTLVFIQYCYNRTQRIIIGSGVSIPAVYWNVKTRSILNTLPEELGNYEKLQAELREKLRRAEKLIDYALYHANTCPVAFLKKNFNEPGDNYFLPKETNREKLDVFYQIEKYIRDKKDVVQPSTLTTIRSMKKHLLCFQEYKKMSLSFDSFDAYFYEHFTRYLAFEVPLLRRNKLQKGLKVNTVGKTIKHFKSFLKDRMARNIIPYSDLSFLKCMEEQVDAVYLSWLELSKVYHLDLSANPCLIKYRDLFVLGCLTGFRFSDYSNIQQNQIRDGMLFTVQKKTLSSVIVPLREDAKKILVDKYDMQMPKLSMVNFNYYIKEVIRLAGIVEPVKICHRRGNKIVEEIRPKYAWISSHTARRSFCTNEYLAGTPSDLIMAISGHKTEKAFITYIKADKVKKASMIKQLWDERPGL